MGSAFKALDRVDRLFQELTYDEAVTLNLADCGHGLVWIELLEVEESVRGCGLGRETMQMLIDLADRHGVSLKLKAITMDGAVSQEALEAFYASFGFVVQHRSWQGYPSMIRQVGPDIVLQVAA